MSNVFPLFYPINTILLTIYINNVNCYAKEYTNWEAGVDDPPFGCLSTGCTSDYGIVARPDAGMQWNADDKSNPLPYICISKCKQGYIWHQGKFLKWVEFNTNILI